MWSANATNNFFILQNLATCFGPYGPSSGDKYRNYIHDYEAYLLLLNLYLYNIEEVLNIQLFT
jgi:hypothetical protein